MDKSILKDIKKLLNVGDDDTSFDQDIIMHINTVISILEQLGIGKYNFTLTGYGENWGDWIENSDIVNFNAVKSLIYLRVRILFDPPTSSVLMDAMKENIKELEWRLNINYEEYIQGTESDNNKIYTEITEKEIVDLFDSSEEDPEDEEHLDPYGYYVPITEEEIIDTFEND